MVKAVKQTTQPHVTGRILHQVAKDMVPFYRKIAGNRSFAAQWSEAVISPDLALMGRLLAQIPGLAGVRNYGTNGIGYFISFPFEQENLLYTNGTTIPPGTVQFTFSTQVHQHIAAAVLPFYRKMASSPRYAGDLAAAIRTGNSAVVRKMVSTLITSDSLKSVTIEDQGVALLFKTRFSKYPYRNLLFQEIL